MPHAAQFCADLAQSIAAHVGDIDRGHRRQLRRAIALAWHDVELLFECFGHARFQLFCAGHHQAQRGEVFPFGTADIGQQKRGRCKEQCGPVFAYHLGHARAIQRIGVVDRREPAQEREPQGCHEPEGVEEGEHAAGFVLWTRLKDDA